MPIDYADHIQCEFPGLDAVRFVIRRGVNSKWQRSIPGGASLWWSSFLDRYRIDANRDVLALAGLRRVMLRIVPFRVAHRLCDRVGVLPWIEKLVLWMIVRKNV
jgi:hypothetical protein